MNPIGIVFGIFFLISNEQDCNLNTKEYSNFAVKLNDSAINLLNNIESDTTIYKISSLLDSSLLIQPNYYPAQFNKLTIDLILGKRINSISILRKLELEKPMNPDIKLMLGILFLTTEDSSFSKIKLEDAKSLYKKEIINSVGNNCKMNILHQNYAICLKMLGNDLESNKTLNSLTYKDNKILKDIVELLLNSKGLDLVNGLSKAR